MGSPPHTWRIQSEEARVKQLNEDHLHIRGEYIANQVTDYGTKGSPPHTWRIPNADVNIPFMGGITSTYVENTACSGFHDSYHKDHLHIRGEYFINEVKLWD